MKSTIEKEAEISGPQKPQEESSWWFLGNWTETVQTKSKHKILETITRGNQSQVHQKAWLQANWKGKIESQPKSPPNLLPWSNGAAKIL